MPYPKPIPAILAFLILLSVSIISGFSQNIKTVTISGKLIDSSKSAVPYATVCLYPSDSDSLLQATLSDTLGRFMLRYSRPGDYRIVIRCFTYKNLIKRISLTMKEKEIDLGRLVLQSDAYSLESVTVKAVNKKAFRVDKMVYSPDSLSLSRSVSGYDLLKYVPGVHVSQKDKLINVNGDKNVLVLVNGRISDRDLSTIHSSEIKQVEVITNPSARYSSETQNVVNIVLKDIKTKGVKIVTSLENSFNNSFTFGNIAVDYENNKTRFFAKYGLSKTYETYADSSQRNEFYQDSELLYKFHPIDNQKYNNLNQTITYGLDHTINKRNFINITCKLSVQNYESYTNDSISTYKDKVQLASKFSSENSHFKTINQNYSVFYRKSFHNPNHKIWFSSNFYILDRNNENKLSSGDLHNPGSGNIWQENTVNRQQSDDTRLEYFFSNNTLKVESGVHFYIRNIDNTFTSAETLETFTYRDNRNAVFTNLLIRKNKYSVQTGLRIESFTYWINSNPEETKFHPLLFLSSSYNISKSQTLRLTYNKRLSYPNYKLLVPFEFYSADSLSSSSGNSHLKPVQAKKIELGYSLKKDDYTLSVIPSYTNYTDYTGTQYTLEKGTLSGQTSNFSGVSKYGGIFSFSAYLSIFEFYLDGNIFYWNFPGEKYDGLSHDLTVDLDISLPAKITIGSTFYLFTKLPLPKWLQRNT